ncbi:MAG TPA: patatin-like phospholipase family protein, partial [Steroidobacteraceae bacterium]
MRQGQRLDSVVISMIPDPQLGEFEQRQKTYLGQRRTVYYLGKDGPGVVLMEEVPGITPHVLRLAKLLTENGFRVAIPSLFGTDGAEKNPLRTAATLVKVCVSREFAVFARNGSSPIVDWIRELCRELAAETGNRVGAVGLCITGGFALSLTVGTDGLVTAPVMSEPALPFSVPLRADTAAMHLTGAEQDALRSAPPNCMGLRFKADPLCRQERFDAYKQLLGDAFTRVEIESPDAKYRIGRRAHSVLTAELSDTPGHPTWDAFGQVVTFLKTMLASAPVQGPVSFDRRMGFDEAISEELKEILPKGVAAADAYHGKKFNLGALCLSGGGIRSATFALGVMQGLARFGLLNQFHYLSSVSGGGYIASWLSRWRQSASDTEVLEALNQSAQKGFEAPQIAGI